MIAPQPVPPGPPVIGSALAYRKDPFGFLERIARTYGEVVALIARDPEVQARLAAEVARLGGAAPPLEDQAITVRPKIPVRLRLSPREAPHG